MKRLLPLFASSLLALAALGCGSGDNADPALQDKTADAGKTATEVPPDKNAGGGGMPAPGPSGLDPTK